MEMKFMKKLIVFILVTIMVASFCGCEKSGTNNDVHNKNETTSNDDVNSDNEQPSELIYDSVEAFDYIDVEGGIAIIEFKNYDHIEYSKIIIPAEINNRKVVGIGSIGDIDYSVFGDFYSPCEVVIPASVYYIGGRAFFGAKNLIKVSGGENCKTVGDYSFANCEDLIDVTFYNQLENVSDSAFIGCNQLIK